MGRLANLVFRVDYAPTLDGLMKHSGV